jgi:hypothetical protein
MSNDGWALLLLPNNAFFMALMGDGERIGGAGVSGEIGESGRVSS